MEVVMGKDLFIRAKLPDEKSKLSVELYAKEHYGSVGAMLRQLIAEDMKRKKVQPPDLSVGQWGGRRPYGPTEEK